MFMQDLPSFKYWQYIQNIKKYFFLAKIIEAK